MAIQANRATVGAMPTRRGIAFFRPEARPATAVGALAVGAAAVGGFAIGRLSVGRLAVGKAAVGKLKVGDLEIGRLHVRETVPTDAGDGPGRD
jgi:hypothetical protein